MVPDGAALIVHAWWARGGRCPQHSSEMWPTEGVPVPPVQKWGTAGRTKTRVSPGPAFRDRCPSKHRQMDSFIHGFSTVQLKRLKVGGGRGRAGCCFQCLSRKLFSCSFSPKGDPRMDGVGLESVCQRLKLSCEEGFRLDMKKELFLERVVMHWHWVPTEVWGSGNVGMWH